MKKGRIYIFCIIAAMLLSGCGKNTEPAAEMSETVAVSDTAAASATKSETKKTEDKKKEIKPLSPNRRQAYFQNEEFSVTAELTKLQSSLYYPDILHDMGINPELFVVTVTVKVKNMTEEEKTFDGSKFTLSDMFSYGEDSEEFKDIPSGKSAVGELRFLCSLEQAAEIDGILYGGEYLEEGEDFYPEEFDDIIDKQSADDVAEYYYRRVRGHSGKGYFYASGGSMAYEIHHIKGIREGGKNYLTVSYAIYNRSDYAYLIDPSEFRIMCSRHKDNGEIIAAQHIDMPHGGYVVIRDDTELERLEPLYIIADEKLIYAPEKAEFQLDGVDDMYEMPEFISMTPENPTDFTVIYDLGELERARFFSVDSIHREQPYYNYMERYASFDWDVWEEKELEQ